MINKIKLIKLLFISWLITFSFQSWAKANEVGDFEIEGMSVGNSALDYFNEKELTFKDDIYHYTSKENKLVKFQTKSYRNYEKPKNFIVYENIEIHYKKNDSKYIIKSISGILYFRNDIDGCLKKKDQIVSEISNSFQNIKKYSLDLEPWIEIDPSGNTQTAHTYFDLSSGSYIEVSCYDWSDKFTKERKYQDHLKVILKDSDFDSLFGLGSG